MAKFLFVICLSALSQFAVARPDVSLGYRYNAGYGSSGSNLVQTPFQSSGSSSSFNYAPSGSGGNYYGSRFGSRFRGSSFVPSVGFGGSYGGSSGGSFGGSSGGSFGGSSGGSFGGSSGGSFGGSFGGGFGNGGNSGSFGGNGGGFSGGAQEDFSPIVSKHFYVYSAPEDHDEQQIVRHINIGRPQKHYRVVFINSPSSNVGRAKIIANVAPTEDKTAIYVLSKKTNELDLSAEVVTAAPVNLKPDVFFIKYNSDAEAVHAQHSIQSQYDALGGSSDLSNEGVAPLSSVVGSLGGGGGGGAGAASSDVGISIAHTGDNTQQTYLPAHHK